MKPILPFGTLLFGAAACGSDDSPTQPPSGQLLSAAVASAGSWSARAAFPGHGLEGAAVAMAPNAAGESVVYLLGGSEGGV